MYIKSTADTLRISSGISWAALFLLVLGVLLMALWFLRPPSHLIIPIRAFGILFVLGGLLFLSKDSWKTVIFDQKNGVITLIERTLWRTDTVSIPTNEISGYTETMKKNDTPGLVEIKLLLKNSFATITFYQGTTLLKQRIITDWLTQHGIKSMERPDSSNTPVIIKHSYHFEWSLWKKSISLIITLLISTNLIWLSHSAFLDQHEISYLIWSALALLYLILIALLITILQYLFGQNTFDLDKENISFGYRLLGREFYKRQWKMNEITQLEIDLGHADIRSLFFQTIPNQEDTPAGHKIHEIPVGGLSLKERYQLSCI